MATSFIKVFNNNYDKCFPIKVKNIDVKRLKKPWLTKGIINCINEKHQLFKNLKNSDYFILHYLKYKNILKSVIRTSKKKLYDNKFKDANTCIRSTWKVINSVIGNGKQK